MAAAAIKPAPCQKEGRDGCPARPSLFSLVPGTEAPFAKLIACT